ncbi:LAGLIDADG family homing endonuclease [Sutcliffiella horikoshii]|uniref:LAGLIDADG family homing endonuclease n=1 Tax=Sutcliffiella horikoshii TaxID=79883 RepID=UPI003CFA2190
MKQMPSRKITLDLPEIIKIYNDGMSTTEIAIAGNVSSRRITQILKKNNVELRPRGHWKRKYHINEDYFKHWSPNMAYILGFFLADGTITEITQTVSISQKEIGILEQIRDEMKSNHPIGKNKYGVYFLNINSKIIKEDLMNIHGLTPNKSKTVEFPYVPEEYMHHFVRGYFDGDGSINYKKYVVTFVGGSELFLSELMKVLVKQQLTPSLKDRNSHYPLFISGRKSIQTFSKWIYKNKTLYLQRKFNEFNKEKLAYNELKDRAIKVTKEAVLERRRIFINLLKVNGCVKLTSEKIGISPYTYKTWLKKDRIFEQEFNSILN